jgi:hypothetical protein
VPHPRHEELQRLVDEVDIDGILAIVTLDDIASAWCRYHLLDEPAEDNPDWWAVDLFMTDEFLDDHQRLRDALLRLIEHAPTESVVGCIGAGPLENFVSDDDGDLRWIEANTTANEKLRVALSYVWCDGYVTEATMARLDSVAATPLARRPPRDQWRPELIAFDDASTALSEIAGEDWWSIENPTPAQTAAIEAFLAASNSLLDIADRPEPD